MTSVRLQVVRRRAHVRRLYSVLRVCLTVAGALGVTNAAEPANTPDANPMLQKYCFTCHAKAAMAGLNFQQLSTAPAMAEHFQKWEMAAAAVDERRMPPAKMPQPTAAERRQIVSWIRANLRKHAEKNAGDPGRVTVRRLTSGEYAYTVRDLTGLDLKLDRDFATDSAGGEGFTNFGDVQFMQDATLERYLEFAKTIANHAVVGSGPLSFYEDPGKSGFELSAIQRIQDIYTAHGFRAVSAEGGQAYGLERYSKAFYATWRYQHRAALGQPAATLDRIAARETLSPKFVRHIWTFLQQPSPGYPSSEVVSQWRNLPAPSSANRDQMAAKVRAGCDDIRMFLINWPRRLFAAGDLAMGGQGDERALVITDQALDARPSHPIKFNVRAKPDKTRIYITVFPVNPVATDQPSVQWRNAAIRFRAKDRGIGPSQPLASVLDAESLKKLGLTKPAAGARVGSDFTINGAGAVYIDVLTPAETLGVELQAEAAINASEASASVLRLTVSQSEEVSKGAPAWALLAKSTGPGYKAWKAAVLEFAANLPQASHSEPTPADRDPIPPPFDNTYNQPERDHYHVKLKYYRSDRFIVEKMLDAPTRAKLEQAWADLYSSFDYHDEFLRFVAGKYQLDLKGKSIATLTDADIASMPAEPRGYITPLRAEYLTSQKAQLTSQPGHIEDCLNFASRAWRRPLTPAEKESLHAFYRKSRGVSKLDHPRAIRALLSRILVAPEFLYRIERPEAVATAPAPVPNWEMASRLSYFLWSSLPDAELRRAAAAGELTSQTHLEKQVRRMLADPKARRMASEFFGQWLGFYRFDQYKGVDTGRFPEFTDELRLAMHNEAVSFFEHIVRRDRPVRDILYADYTFLNQPLAKFYGVKAPVKSLREPELVERANSFQRGGVLRLGALLTATSAPLRTSPVKRGDWVLRRILGTPTPPPPADAGSLPADDKSFGDLTLFEKLEVHKRNPSCAGCHTRIDPMGFPLERYDAIGRWRDTYSDGKPIHDSATTADQKKIDGVNGLADYLRTQERQVLKNFSQKLLGYALGRTMLVTDQPLIEQLISDGANATFSTLVTDIVTSRQFRYRRGPRPGPAGGSQPRQLAQGPAATDVNTEGGR